MIQDEDAPDLDEMETTTQRNRRGGGPEGRFHKAGRNAPPGPVAPMPKRARGSQKFPMNKKQPGVGDNPFEGTAPLKKSHYQNGEKPDGDGEPTGGKGGSHHGIAIIISPMSNPVEEHRQSVRGAINKSVSQLKRRK